MVFSSLLFLFLYLPIVLGIYYLIPRRFRNLFLFAANLVFYGWGEPVFILVMIFSTVVNYIYGLLIHKYQDRNGPLKFCWFTCIIVNLGLLGFFKYAGFVASILQSIPCSPTCLPL